MNIGQCCECSEQFVCGDCIYPRCPKCEVVHRRGNKICGHCKKEKPLAEFVKDGWYCDECKGETERRVIESHRTAIKTMVHLLRDTRSYSIGNGVPSEWFIKRDTILKQLEHVE